MSIPEKAKAYFGQSWDAIKLAWMGGVGIVKKGWTIFALAAALAGAAGYILWLNHKNEAAQQQIEEVQAEAKRLAEQSNELIQLNKENQAVYQQLQQDREHIDALVTTFNYQLQANARALNSIGNSVSKLADGQLAPVLRETVRELQRLREERDAKK